MSERERTGKRDLTYSSWHRSQNLVQYLEPLFQHIADYRQRQREAHIAACNCTMIDVDGLEYCRLCKAPLALIELKHAAAREKSTAVLEALGKLAVVPVFLVEYTTVDDELATIRVTRRYPRGGINRASMTLHEWAKFVYDIHQSPHECRAARRTA